MGRDQLEAISIIKGQLLSNKCSDMAGNQTILPIHILTKSGDDWIQASSVIGLTRPNN